MSHSTVHNFKSDILRELKKIFPIETFPEIEIQKLLRVSEVRKYRTGQMIIEQGQTDGLTYYLVSGQVSVEKDGNLLFDLRRRGDLFGEMSAVDGFQRSASVMALVDTVCIAVNMKRLENVAEAEGYAFKYFIYRNIALELSAKLRSTTSKLLQAKKEIEQLKGLGNTR
jgi:CRP-like cAMP-binding protein